MAALRRRKAMACTVAFVFSLIVDLTRSLPEVIKVGGLFEAGDDVLELTFRYAVDRVNSDGEMLPKSLVSAQVERLEQHDSFQAARKVCDLLEQGLAAVFGPQSVEASSAVQSTCDVLQVPHIETRWDYRTRHDNHSLNLYPHPGALGKAYLDFVKSKNWNYFAILYEDNDALIRMQELLKDPFVRDRRVVVRQFPPNQEYRKLLKELGRGGVKNIVLDVATSNIHTVLKHAQQVDMMSEYYNYFITSLDLHTVDLEDFQYGGTNITGFRLVHQESPDFADVLKDWKNSPLRYHKTLSVEDDFLKTEVALMYDAVKLLSKALHDLDRSQKIHIRSISCENEDPWPHGNSLVKYMRMIQFQGLTGNIKFDHRGFRTDFTLKVIELTHEGLKQAGHWNSSGLFASSNYTRAIEEIIQSLKNKTLIVTSIINHPYTIRKVGGANEKLEGNDRYEGYCVDLIDAISKNLGFDYVFKEVDDGRYGSRNEHGEWNGMIRELIDGKADLAIGDLTITYVREQAVDFTMPFMNLGISILFRKPNRKIPNLFSFLSPLSVEVWLYMVTAFLGVTLFLFIVARFSPYEWTNPHPCNQEPEELENQFTILNTLWFTIGCLMQQGCELTPRAVSTRVVAGIWWFFTLIMVSSYTANLAAFLTVERMVSPIESAEDLAKQTSIHYGCVGSGSTKVFFKESKIPTYKRMWAFMESARPNVFTDSNMKGVERVRKGNYAFLMESTTIEYIVERNCDLTQVGGMLDSKGYGIATPSGSPYRTPLSSAILQLQESGTLHLLKERWWKQKNPGRVCKSEETSRSSGSANELGLANVGGVFVVLLAGLALACIAAVVEFIWKARKEAEEEREPLCVELCRELKFAVICGGSTKPIRKKSDGGGGGTVMGSVMNAHIHGQPENGLPFMPLTGFNTSSTKETFS